jgi:arginine/lysine/ornithine decarboxylase
MEKYLKKIENHISFHMPGHKGREVFDSNMQDITKWDITEIPGADNLQDPEGIIKAIEDRYGAYYESTRSFIMVNGSTGGILSMIMAATKPGDTVIVDSNCHKAVINGLMLGRLNPIFVNADTDTNGIPMSVNVDKIIDIISSRDDIKAVIITSPNYFGYVSNISKLKKAILNRDIVVMVDEAHGSHLRLSCKLPDDSIEMGADIVVHSIHKTLLGLTQTAALHVNSYKIDIEKIKHFLYCFQTSSPSYILMASLEKSIDIVEKKGEDLMEKLLFNIDEFFNDCNEYLSIVKVLDYRNLKNYDNTKLILDIANLDISTSQFLDILAKDYSIEVEMTMGEYILLMTSINSEKKDFDELLRALMDIEKIYGVKNHKKENLIDYAFKLNQKVNPWTAFYMEKEDIKLKDSVGRISGSSIVPYPPGIPVISVGQEITKDVVSFIIKNRNSFNQIIGLKDEEIKVLKGC